MEIFGGIVFIGAIFGIIYGREYVRKRADQAREDRELDEH